MVDDHCQIVVHAEAHGSGYEGHLLAPLLEATRATFGAMDPGNDVLKNAQVTADAGFHSRVVVAQVEALGVDAYIPDRDHRKRDAAFADAERHEERSRKDRARERPKQQEQAPQKAKLFTREDFSYDAETALCVCPAGHKLYQSGNYMLFNGDRVAHFKAPLSACRDCELRSQCLRHPEGTAQRQLTIIKDREGPRSKGNRDDGPVERMKLKLDTGARTRALLAATRHRRARVCQPAEQGDATLHAPRQTQSRRAVAALRHGARHREDRRQGTGELSAEPAGPLRPTGMDEARSWPFQPKRARRATRAGGARARTELFYELVGKTQAALSFA